MSKSPADDFVEAMQSMWAEIYGYQGVPWRRYKTILRTLAVAFVDEGCSSINDESGKTWCCPLHERAPRLHDDHRTEFLRECGLEDTP